MTTPPLTPDELRAEMLYRVSERVGMHGYSEKDRVPDWLNRLAWEEADEAVAVLKGEKPDPMRNL